MNVTTVLHRELQAESRRPANHWLRVLAASVLLVVFVRVMTGSGLPASQIGAVLFAFLHHTFVASLWLLVPLMTADCVSREKREGTLGLLFLTSLSVRDVIVGKAAVHVLRAITLFLAAAPLLGLPVMLGGITWRDLAVSLAIQVNAMLLSIGAGILASTKGGTAIQSMVRAELFSIALWLVSSIWTYPLWNVAANHPIHLPWALAFTVLFALGVQTLLVGMATDRLKRTWQDGPAAPEPPGWVELFATSPFWQELFRWDKSQTLDRNPVAWLQEYCWTARLTKWGWCIVALAVQWIVLSGWDAARAPFSRELIEAGFALVIAFTAVASFRREQQTGLLELLLVTPLTVRQILGGRLWGIGCHFLPALAMVFVGWIGDRAFYPQAYNAGPLTSVFPNPLALGCVMVAGLYCSLSRLNFFVAWLGTWAFAFVCPALLRLVLSQWAAFSPVDAVLVPTVLQIVLATILWSLLHLKVRTRNFSYALAEGSATV